MSTPATGYNLSSQLKKAATGAKEQASKAAVSLKADLTATAVNKATDVAKNAADKLKAKLGGKLDKVSSIANAASKAADTLTGLAGKFGKGGDSVDVGAAATASMSLINAKLADTMMVSLPTEEVLTVDAYGIKGKETLNSVVGKLTGFATDLLQNVGGLKGLGSTLAKSALGSITSGGKIDVKSLTERVVSTMGGKSGILSGLSTSLVSGIGDQLGIPPNIYNRIESTIGGAVQSYNAGNMKSASGIFDLVGRITGDSELSTYFDVGAEAQLLSTIYREALNVGLPDAIKAMNSKAKSSEAAYYALQSNLIVAANLGEIQTVSLMTEVLGAARVIGDCPTVVGRLLSAYTFPEGTVAESYPALYTTLVTSLNAIDPNWGRYKRGAVMATDLKYFTSISDDARTLLSSQESFAATAIKLAPSYPTADLLQVVKTNYPQLVL